MSLSHLIFTCTSVLHVSEACITSMKQILGTLVSCGRLPTSACDDVMNEFRDFLTDVSTSKDEFANFEPNDKDQRIEKFLRYTHIDVVHVCHIYI